ncbi:MAG: PIG-L family deacetylase [Elusimicrobiales bacterium]|nr:PIG-L family deacetylase [Elusimicrobiales bacterium]
MKILGIGPHPDDLEFGCGGTLQKMAAKGHKIHMLVMTQGSVGGDPRARMAEQQKAAALLNARLYWGGFEDTGVTLTRELIRSVEKHIEAVKPDLVFVNHAADTHQDHRSVAQAAETAARYTKNLLFYEVPTTMDFNPGVFVDIGPVMTRKVSLLKCHRSQVYKTRVKNLSIIESAKAAAMFRGYQDRVKYAEGFVPRRLLLDHLLDCGK